jgi:hypothetical protein
MLIMFSREKSSTMKRQPWLKTQCQYGIEIRAEILIIFISPPYRSPWYRPGIDTGYDMGETGSIRVFKNSGFGSIRF